MTISSFKDLIVWQRAAQLSSAVYELTSHFPRSEMYALSDQMQPASISIVSNIAEGRHRGSPKEFLRYLRIAYASATELEAQIYIAQKFPHTKNCDYTQILSLLTEVLKMLNTMTYKLHCSLKQKRAR